MQAWKRRCTSSWPNSERTDNLCKTCSLSCSCHWGVRKSIWRREPRLDCPWHKRDCKCCCSGDGTQCQEDRPTAICRIHQRMYQRQDQATRWHHSSQQATTVLYSYPQGTQRKAAVDLPEEWCSTLLAIVHRLSDTWWKPLSSRKSSLSPITVKCRETSPRCQEWFAGVPGGSFWSTICSTKSVIDGAAVVQMLKPGTAKTFQEYANQVFIPYISGQLQYVSHLDLVWDSYRGDSLKATARAKRGKGVRRRVIESAPVPGISCVWTSTKRNSLVSSPNPSSSHSPRLPKNCCYRWGTGSFCAITKWPALAQNVFLFGTWEITCPSNVPRTNWMRYCVSIYWPWKEDCMDDLELIARAHWYFADTSACTHWNPRRKYERFVILIYDRTSTCTDINKARKKLFAKKSSVMRIPPTRAALEQHVKRAAFQGGHVWGQTLLPQPALPSPCNWGWIKTEGLYEPYWTTLPEASKTCYELVSCGCKKGCVKNCKCKKAGLQCTALCQCEGECTINWTL